MPQVVNLRSNQIGSQGVRSLTEVLLKMPSLKRLDLYNNRMTGDVPPGIQNLTNLKELYLSGNELTGTIV